MSHFFFNLRLDDGSLLRDDDGLELPGLMEVRQEAQLGAKDLLKEAVDKDEPIGAEQFEVTDDVGRVRLVYPVRDAIRLS